MTTLRVLLIWLAVGVTMQDSALRTWRYASGKTEVKARLVNRTRRTITLQTEEGQTLEIPVVQLSRADRRYLAALDKPKPAVEPAAPKGFRNAVQATPKQPPRNPFNSAPASSKYRDTPLRRALDALAAAHKTPLWLDTRGVADAAIDDGAPVGPQRDGVSLQQGLEDLLEPFDLNWATQGGVVVVSTPKTLQGLARVRVYRARRPLNWDALVESITKEIEPQSWSDAGGSGTASLGPGDTLVIRQSGPVQRKIAARFPEVLDAVPTQPLTLQAMADQNPVALRLLSPVTLNYIETPTAELVVALSRATNTELTLDIRSLEDGGFDPQARISMKLRGEISLLEALDLVVHQLDLQWELQSNRVVIATSDRVRLLRVKYPLRRLLAKSRDPDALLQVFESAVAPGSWSVSGGEGTAKLLPGGVLEVLQTTSAHLEIAQLLADLQAK